MPDISMCLNKTCTLKETCYRFKAIPNPHYQAYSEFVQDKSGKCVAYDKVKETDKLS